MPKPGVKVYKNRVLPIPATFHLFQKVGEPFKNYSSQSGWTENAKTLKKPVLVLQRSEANELSSFESGDSNIEKNHVPTTSNIGDDNLCSTQILQLPRESSQDGTENNPRIRLDIVKKTIFRYIKKYYMDNFKAFYNYKSHRARSKFSQEVYNQAKLYLVCLVDINQRYTAAHHKYPNLRNSLSSLIRAYNNDKAKALLSMSEFSELVINALNDTSSLNDFVSQKGDSKVQDVYWRQVEEIKHLCLKNMTK